MDVFEKLNLKHHRDVLVLNAPASFEPELAKLADVGVRRRLPDRGAVDFALVFATEQSQVDAVARRLSKLAPGDAIVWFAYPKGSSKRYTCSFNRDSGWKLVGQAGFEPVRQVAIDEDWSALRFRRAEFIKSMARAPERALSKQGRKLASGGAAPRRRPR